MSKMTEVHLQELGGLVPIIRLAQFLGLAPYFLENTFVGLRRVPKKFTVLYSSFYLCALGLDTVWWFFYGLHNGIETVTNSVWESACAVIASCLELALPFCSVIAAVKFKLPKINTILQQLTAIEEKTPSGGSHLEKMPWNAGLIIFYIIYHAFSSGLLAMAMSFTAYSALHSILNWWLQLVVCCVCHSFCAVCTLLKCRFEHVNQKIFSLKNNLRDLKSKKMFAILKQTKPKLSLCVNRSDIHEYADDETIAENIKKLRRIHFLAVDICHHVEEVFSVYFLLFYTYLCMVLVWNLFWAGMAPVKPNVSACEVVQGSLSSMSFVVLGAWVAASSGAVTAAAGNGALRAAAALLVETCDFRQAEHQAQMLVLQLRAHPVKFTAGGLFTMNLRFLVGFWGTIIGYFVVALQLAQTSQCENTVKMSNCSES